MPRRWRVTSASPSCLFGPEDGAISSTIVYEAAREAHFLKYDQLYFFGFAIQAEAREMIDTKQLRIPASLRGSHARCRDGGPSEDHPCV